MKYSGIDLHSNNSVVTVTDEADRVVAEKRLPNDPPKILAFLSPWQAELAGVVVESTFNHRDKAAARRYFEKAMNQNGAPETVTMDKSGANLAAIQSINAERETSVKVRQVRDLNNIVEQDHRAIKRIINPMMGFKDFRCARIILSGIEVMNMIRKGQMKDLTITQTAPAQFYSLLV
jgi:hypothetical protein